MPLHVNLYHEIQRQEIARRRDPLRLGMLGILVIAVGFVVYYFVELERCREVSATFAGLQDDWARLEPKYNAAKAREAELNAQIDASNNLMNNVEGRFYVAPVMGEILRTVPRNVQITHVTIEAPADEQATGSLLSVSGVASAVEPRKAAEELRMALEGRLGSQFKSVTSEFKGLDDSDQTVSLDGQHLATAIFNVEYQMQVKDAAPAAPPPPPRRQRIAAE